MCQVMVMLTGHSSSLLISWQHWRTTLFFTRKGNTDRRLIISCVMIVQTTTFHLFFLIVPLTYELFLFSHLATLTGDSSLFRSARIITISYHIRNYCGKHLRTSYVLITNTDYQPLTLTQLKIKKNPSQYPWGIIYSCIVNLTFCILLISIFLSTRVIKHLK